MKQIMVPTAQEMLEVARLPAKRSGCTGREWTLMDLARLPFARPAEGKMFYE